MLTIQRSELNWFHLVLHTIYKAVQPLTKNVFRFSLFNSYDYMRTASWLAADFHGIWFKII